MTEKTKKPRRTRVDAKEGVAAAISAGGKTIAIPTGMKLDDKERTVFTELCDEFSNSELSAHKIRLVVGLAKNIAALDREQDTLSMEGAVLINSHGNAFPNPRAKVCTGLVSTILSTRRSLGIHTRAQAGGDNREAAKRRAHNRTNEAARAGYDDGLIPFPHQKDDTDDSVH